MKYKFDAKQTKFLNQQNLIKFVVKIQQLYQFNTKINENHKFQIKMQFQGNNNNGQTQLIVTKENEGDSVLNIFHFNDVYDIQPSAKEPKAGAAYFKSLLDRYRKQYQKGDKNLTLFSGDAFSPSMLSSEFQGRNMIKPLNAFGIDLACLGNHDLDYQLDHVMQLKNATNFQWLLSNIYNNKTQRRLAEGLEYKIIEKNGIKIGIFNLAQKQWIDTLYPFYYQICQYIPYVQFAQSMVELLKREHKCDVLIALTHMMKYNDAKLAEAVPEIDLILGGHDHLILHEKVNNSVIVKSGTNFRNFSIISVFRKDQNRQQKEGIFTIENKNWIFQIKLVEVHHENQKIQPDPQLQAYVHQIYHQFAQKQNRVAIYTAKQIDLTFNTIRKQQSCFLEFIAAFYRHHLKGDCAFLNSGNFRADLLIPPGPITLGTLTNIIQDQIVVKMIPGKDVLQGLENMVSMYPNLSGRMAALSGICFTWDSHKQPFHRILKQTVIINKQPLNQQKIYRVCLHSFTAFGGDGYSVFKPYPYSQDHRQTNNRVLVKQLENPDNQQVKSFLEKYPNFSRIKEVDGQKYIEVDLPAPKNVKMI